MACNHSPTINTMEQSSSWEANNYSVKKFPIFYETRRFMTLFTRVRHWSVSWILQSPRPCVTFRKKVFYGEELLALRPTPRQEEHPMSAVRDCLFSIFAATFHIWRPSPPSATWGRAMSWWQGTRLTLTGKITFFIF